MRLFVALLALLTVVPPAAGQPRRDDARAGRLAVVGSVRWDRLGDLPPPIDGVGVRYWAGDRTVVGGTVGLTLASTEGVADLSSVRGAVWVERHLGRRRGPVSPFVSVDLDAARYENGAIYAYPDCLPDAPCPPFWTGEQSVSSIGASVGAGAEVRLLRGLTLTGGYRVRLEGERISYVDFSGGAGGSSDLNVVTFGTGAADLRLSIYF